ncbi:MAG: hypothetical protein HOJ73_04485 [Nitrosomonadales bacterium]|nr:hypothetical protein [Nitrosomonadales bacterium]
MTPIIPTMDYLYEFDGFAYHNENGKHVLTHHETMQTFELKYTFGTDKIPTYEEFQEVVDLWKV